MCVCERERERERERDRVQIKPSTTCIALTIYVITYNELGGISAVEEARDTVEREGYRLSY